MLNLKEEIKNILIDYCKHVDGVVLKDDEFVEDVFLKEILMERGKEVYREVCGEHRWWNEVFVVIDFDGKFIGYVDAETTGDRAPYEVGWEFDPETVVECQPETKVVTVYVPIKERK